MFARFSLAILVSAFVVTSAICAGYDSFSVGMAAFNRGDTDLAIKEFTEALAAGDLNAGLVPVTHLDRGLAFLRLGKCADAASDAASALALKPDYLDALGLRASASACSGDYKAAIADYQALLAKHAGPGDYRELALLYWMAGDFVGAQQPLQKANTLDPHQIYGVLWLEIMRARAGNPDMDAMAQDVSHIDIDEWPGPVFNLFLGKFSPEDTISAAAKGDTDSLAGRQCEANFYVAEWWFSKGQPAKAWPLLDDAKAHCPKGFFEYRLAVAELKRPH